MASAWVVVEREVGRGARRWQTYAWRTAFAAAMFAAVIAFYNDRLQWMEWNDTQQLAWVGRELFELYSTVQWWLLGLITPIVVSQGIVEEREANTLELLSISRLAPRHLLLGKLLSSLASVYLLMLSGLPVMALCLGFGGVAPAEIANAFLHTAVGVFALGAMSAYFGLFAKSPLGPLLLTWNGAFWGWSLLAAPGALAMEDDDGFGMTSIAYAFFEGADDMGAWTVLPALVWIGVALAILRFGEQVFVTQVSAGSGDDPDAALLSSDLWRVERTKKSVLGAAFMLALLCPALLIGRLSPPHMDWWFKPLGYGFSFLWNVAAIVVAMLSYCIVVRGVMLWFTARRERAPGSWRALAADGERDDHDALGLTLTGSVPAVAPRRSLAGKPVRTRVRSKRIGWARAIWANPVAWRETVTRAHGFVAVVAGKAYILALVLGAMAWAYAPLREEMDLEATLVLAVGGFLFCCFAALLAATSSMVGEKRKGTLALLCVTPMSGGRILRGKLMGVLAFVGPPFAVSSIALLFATPYWGGQRYSYWTGYGGVPSNDVLVLRWVAVVAVAGAAVLMIAAGSLWIAARARTAGRAWVTNLLWVGAVAAGPLVALAFWKNDPTITSLVGWFNPVLDEEFWTSQTVPDRTLISAGGWIAVALAVLAHAGATLRDRAAR